jgi:hypothetical protein
MFTFVAKTPDTMSPEAVLQFVKTHYGQQRQALVPLLLDRLQGNNPSEEIYRWLSEGVNRPMHGKSAGSDEADARLRTGVVDLTSLGDTSDAYTFVLNAEIQDIHWDLAEVMRREGEVHEIRLWINWFAPVYFLQCEFTRGLRKGTAYQFGPLESLMPAEAEIVGRLHQVMDSHGFTALTLPFLEQRFPELSSDFHETDASIYECLFSDCSYPQKTHVERKAWWK